MAEVGRPSSYKIDYCGLLLTHMQDGMSFESFGGVVGVSERTLYTWCDNHEEFLQSKEIGQAFGRHYWEKVGKDGLYNEVIKTEDGATVTRSINQAIWSMFMKNRFGWKDKKEIDQKTEQVGSSVDDLKEQLRIANELNQKLEKGRL